MKVEDYEIFKFSENIFRPFENNGITYNLNKHPYLDVVLTDKCNSNCNFCIADLIHKKLNCDLEVFKSKILYAVNKMNVDEVLLLGGEPTVSKDLIPLIKWLKTLNLAKIVMTTNGILLANSESYREKVLKSGLTHINISFMNSIERLQKEVTNAKSILTTSGLAKIYKTAKKHNVKIRINNNIFLGNNDYLGNVILFYNSIKDHCDSVKFSPILPVDDFSVINTKTTWAKEHLLSDEKLEHLFNSIQNHFVCSNNVGIIENNLQFGFVKNTMIPLRVPIILNWNFGKHTGMMNKVVNHKQINNIKLLSNNELSLSWNRELDKYFIKTI